MKEVLNALALIVGYAAMILILIFCIVLTVQEIRFKIESTKSENQGIKVNEFIEQDIPTKSPFYELIK